ncbi:MAG: hypothetical protein AAGG38_03420 [Planctomycetota bacterium]
MDQVDVGGNLFDLVPLELADHVPADLVGGGVVGAGGRAGEGFLAAQKLGELGDTLGELLDPALAEVGLPHLDDLADLLHTRVFGDRDHGDVFSTAADFRGGGGDAVVDPLVGVFELIGAGKRRRGHGGRLGGLGGQRKGVGAAGQASSSRDLTQPSADSRSAVLPSSWAS